jgi:hypothetical protein
MKRFDRATSTGIQMPTASSAPAERVFVCCSEWCSEAPMPPGYDVPFMGDQQVQRAERTGVAG